MWLTMKPYKEGFEYPSGGRRIRRHGLSNARDALNALREQPCDLLLTDLRLPCLSGTELIREALKISPDLSAILMTGHGSMETAVEAMQMGVLDYILKPFKFTEISPVIRRALENRRLRLQNAVLLAKVTVANQRLTDLNADLDSFCCPCCARPELGHAPDSGPCNRLGQPL